MNDFLSSSHSFRLGQTTNVVSQWTHPIGTSWKQDPPTLSQCILGRDNGTFAPASERMERFSDNKYVLSREWTLGPVTDVHHGEGSSWLLEMPVKLVGFY